MRGPRIPSREDGFSLIEVIIASLIMLVVALGVIPLFAMGMQSNLAGSENTKVANYARERLEELWAMPFDDPRLTIDSDTEKHLDEYFDESTEQWTLAGATIPDGTLWTRNTTIRQFAVSDLATPLTAGDATADPARVHLKEITVEVHNARTAGPFGGGKEMTLRAYKAQ